MFLKILLTYFFLYFELLHVLILYIFTFYSSLFFHPKHILFLLIKFCYFLPKIIFHHYFVFFCPIKIFPALIFLPHKFFTPTIFCTLLFWPLKVFFHCPSTFFRPYPFPFPPGKTLSNINSKVITRCCRIPTFLSLNIFSAVPFPPERLFPV